jgi:cytidylate kinase
MPIVTISRQYASGGSEIAEQVATQLGWSLFDNAVVDRVAAQLGITPAEVSAREERRPSLVERIASAISLSAPEMMPTVGDPSTALSEERLVAVTSRVVEEAIQAGPAVIVGRGAQCLLASRTDVLHVFCYAPMESLMAYAVSKLGVRPEDARSTVTEMNAQREDYVKRHWKREWRDLANYHLCVNTASFGMSGAAALITRVARERFGTA